MMGRKTGFNMYLISIYFDLQTEKRLQGYIKSVANETGNSFMVDNHVPPHITVAAMESRDEQQAIKSVEDCVRNLKQGRIKWVSMGTFFSQVLYVQPVLNEYLHDLSVQLNEAIKILPETKVSPYYKPFGWLPHATIAKQLSKEQMQEAFVILQNQFV